eukprot:364471-Chlamydomonas_euryale.AAC.4
MHTCTCAYARSQASGQDEGKPADAEEQADQQQQEGGPLVALAKLAADVVVNPLFYVVAGRSTDDLPTELVGTPALVWHGKGPWAVQTVSDFERCGWRRERLLVEARVCVCVWGGGGCGEWRHELSRARCTACECVCFVCVLCVHHMLWGVECAACGVICVVCGMVPVMPVVCVVHMLSGLDDACAVLPHVWLCRALFRLVC